MVKVASIQAYADGLLSDEELAELASTSISHVILPVEEPGRQRSESGKHATRCHTSVSPVPLAVSPERVKVAGSIAPRPSNGVAAVGSRGQLPSGSSSRSVAAPVSSKKPTPALSKEELEVSYYQSITIARRLRPVQAGVCLVSAW